jgi:hypothetical protein
MFEQDRNPVGLKGFALLPLFAILMIAAYRLAPHPWNVAPVGAMFVLGGLYMGRSWRGWVLPFAAVLVSDALVYLRWDGTVFHPERLVDYVGFAMIAAMGLAAASRGWKARVASVVATPVLFYLVSNFGVWLASTVTYPHTLSGLADCYVAALPFLRGTLIGDWLFAGAGMLAIEGLPRLGVRRLSSAEPVA